MPFTQMRWQMSAVLRADYDASHNRKEKISAGSGTSSRSHLRPLMLRAQNQVFMIITFILFNLFVCLFVCLFVVFFSLA